MSKHALFIFNPNSGKKEIRRQLFYIIDTFNKNNIMLTCHPTQKAMDCFNMIKKYGNMLDLIVVAWGDGTLSETVTAIMQMENEPPVAYIP